MLKMSGSASTDYNHIIQIPPSWTIFILVTVERLNRTYAELALPPLMKTKFIFWYKTI